MTQDEPTKVTFSDFVFLQYQQARFSLGMFPNPQTGKYEENLLLAQYAIDVLCLLKEKTRGNLEAMEEKLLENVLHELRLAFVEKSRETAGGRTGGKDEQQVEGKDSESGAGAEDSAPGQEEEGEREDS